MSTEHAIAELANAIHRIDEHLVTLHDRLTRIEETQAEWTTRGWEAPPGADRSSDEGA